MSTFHDWALADTSRRRFLTQTSLAVAGLASAGTSDLFAAGDAAIRIGVIGCGGRGTGAMLDALGAATKVIYPSEGYHTEDVAEGTRVAHENIDIVALADLFPDRLARARDQLKKLGMEIPEARTFTGFRAGIVVHTTGRCMNDQCTFSPEAHSDFVDSRCHFDNPPCSGHALDRVPHVDDDHRSVRTVRGGSHGQVGVSKAV